MQDLLLMKDMNDSQKLIFQNELNKRIKDPTIALLLTLFLGGVGAHHYYMGKIGLGVLYTLFCWSFIPGFISFIELFFIMGRVKKYNDDISIDVALKIKMLYT